MRKLFSLAVLALPYLFPTPAWAWGCSGHEIVALIAHQELETLDAAHRTQVLPEVERLLAFQDRNYPHRYCADLSLDPMAFWATWADDHRAVDPKTGSWHYWNIPLSLPSGAAGQYCAEGCVIQALEKQIAILRDKTRPDSVRSTALLWVLHLVGDMHQPLHEEDNNDRGGNCVPVNFLDHKAEQRPNGGYSPNLHGIWDTDLVKNIGGIDRKAANASTEVTGFARHIDQDEAKLIRRSAKMPVDLVKWANQAHGVARALVYPDLQPPVAPVATAAASDSCGPTADGYFARHETAGAAYVAMAQPVIERQLALAGARLADVLYSSLR